jgi:hypothetical protein
MAPGTSKNHRKNLASLLPALIGFVLLVWGIWVTYAAFAFGTLPVVDWHTAQNRRFGVTWLIAFVIVLMPAYLYSISLWWQSLQTTSPADQPQMAKHWPAAMGVSVLLCALTFSARVAVTAWFPSAMHPPFEDIQGGLVSGSLATMILLILEAGVLAGIKHQTRRDQKPYPLLIPGCFALALLVWAGWVTYTAFTNGALPVLRWQTEKRWLLGVLWLAVFCIVLLPAYLYAMFLGILALMERRHRDETVQQNFWLVAVSNTALLCLITFCARLAVTAWFPEQLHAPLHHFNGGAMVGLPATILLGLVMCVFYRTAKSF